MSTKSLTTPDGSPSGWPLRLVLVVPFVALLVVVVALVAWLSLRQGERAVEGVARQLREELALHISEYVGGYLENAHRINRLNADALAVGQLDESAPEAMAHFFRRQLDAFDGISYVFFGTAGGGAVGAGRRQDGVVVVDATDVNERGLPVAGTRFEYAAVAGGRRGELLQATPGFDGRRRPWFHAALEAGDAVWSDVYLLFGERSLAIAASRPVFHADGTLRGVLGVDLALGEVSDFLGDLAIGQNGSAFIVERQTGRLVASSSADMLLGHSEDGTPERLWAVDSPEPAIGETARFLAAQSGGFHRFDTEAQLAFVRAGERQLVQVSPLNDARGLDWLLVTAVPEADFLAGIREGTRNTLWLSAAALAVAAMLALWAARWIARPILDLHRASQDLAAGDWTAPVAVRGVRELIELAAGLQPQ